jgi:hypothetical protein
MEAGNDGDEVDLGAEDALELDLEEDGRERRRRMVHIWYVVFAAFFGLVLGLAAMFALVVNSSRGSRDATCAVVAASRAEKRAQLAEYEANPPTSELARNLEQTYRDSLATWDQLWSTLRCKDTALPGP